MSAKSPGHRKGSDPGTGAADKRKLIAFDAETWQALHQLSRDSLKSVQELAEEAFVDLLKKHRRPVGLKQALRESVRRLPANDPSRRRGKDKS